MQTEAVFDKIADRIQDEIIKANRSIFIAVAWFTNKKLFNELVNKSKNGCTVSLIISNDIINQNSAIDYDQLNSQYSKVYKIGDGNAELMHNKFCVIDYNTVITGSYNWSYKAESNFENIIITSNDTALAEQFISEFNKIRNRYYYDEIKEDLVFPLDKILRRLEILKNYILLEDIEELDKEILKLSKYEFNFDLFEITDVLKRKEFSKAINKIQNFISKNQQILIWTDPEIKALKLEIKNLENQLNAYDNEKIEIGKTLSDFQHRYSIELGEIVLSILNLRKLLYKNDSKKYKEAKADENKYREQLEKEIERNVFELTHDQKIELKKKFRKATVLCHPDKVSEEYKITAQEIFMELKQVYDANNLVRVSEILSDLEEGNFFKAKSETINEKDLLKVSIAKLRAQIQTLETEIINLKQNETYQTVKDIDKWDEYFEETKEILTRELEELQIEIKAKK